MSAVRRRRRTPLLEAEIIPVPVLAATFDIPVGSLFTAIKFNSLDSPIASRGKKMYIVSNGDRTIYQFQLPNAFDISVVDPFDSVDKFVVPLTDEGNPTGLAWSATGKGLFVVGDSSNDVHEYAVSSSYSIKTTNPQSLTADLVVGATTPTGLVFNNFDTVGTPGEQLYVSAAIPAGQVRQFKLNTAYTLQDGTSPELPPFLSAIPPVTNPRSVEFSNDGSRMFLIDPTTDKVHQYSLSAPFDVTTGTITNTADLDLLQFGINSPFGMAFSNDGFQMFIVDAVAKKVFQITLVTPFQLIPL